MKTCTKCNSQKQLSEFYFRKDNNTHRNECKECTKAAKAVRESVPGVKVIRAQKERERRKTYKDKINSTLRKQRSTYLLETVRLANLNNRHKRRSITADGITTAELKLWKTEQFPCCVYCGSTANLTMDHIEPLNTGGTHTVDNLCIACKSCNCSKQTKSLIHFMAYKQIS